MLFQFYKILIFIEKQVKYLKMSNNKVICDEKFLQLVKNSSIIEKWRTKERGYLMRIFFNSTFIKQETLNEAGIIHPIKLEYYKIINEDEIIKKEKAKFGINVVKTEYIENNIKVEDKKIQYVSNDERKIEEILNLLKEYEVTPIAVEDVLNDFSKKFILI